MAFRGFLYDAGKVNGDYSKVCAPPYDVISERERDKLYEKSSYNIVQLILGKFLPGDDSKGNNKYSRAGKLLREWIKEGVIRRDNDESFYVYLQEYDAVGKKHRRAGFFGLMKIEETGENDILPHEHTLAQPKEDRMNLLKEVKGNLSPIFGLFNDESGEVTEIIEKVISEDAPLIDTEVDGVRHALWRLSDKNRQIRISSAIKEKKVFIADGHHRYAVAKKYRDTARTRRGYNNEAEYILMYLADISSPENLTVMATHRVIKKMPVSDHKDVISRIDDYFDITYCDDLVCLMKKLGSASGKHVFGYLSGDKYIFLEMKNDKDVEKLVRDPKSPEWKQLDVSILHSGIFEYLLGMKDKEGNIFYTRNPDEAEAMVKTRGFDGAFLLNPTRVDQLKAVAENGDMMPQKSTYFYPKLLTGLVINKFEEEQK